MSEKPTKFDQIILGQDALGTTIGVLQSEQKATSKKLEEIRGELLRLAARYDEPKPASWTDTSVIFYVSVAGIVGFVLGLFGGAA